LITRPESKSSSSRKKQEEAVAEDAVAEEQEVKNCKFTIALDFDFATRSNFLSHLISRPPNKRDDSMRIITTRKQAEILEDNNASRQTNVQQQYRCNLTSTTTGRMI